MTKRVGKLRAEVVPIAGADRRLKRVVVRVGSRLDLGDTAELRESAEERSPRIGWRRSARQDLIDVVSVDQLTRLVSYVANLQHDPPRNLVLCVHTEILHVRRPQILVHGVGGERRLRRRAPKDELVRLHDHQTWIAYAEDRGGAARVSRNTTSRIRTCAVINEKVAIDDVVENTIVCADDELSAALRGEGEPETRSEIVVVSRVQRVNVLADYRYATRRCRQEDRNGLAASRVHPTVIRIAHAVIDVQTRRRLPVVLRPRLERVHVIIALRVTGGNRSSAGLDISADEVRQRPLNGAEACVTRPRAGASVKREG